MTLNGGAGGTFASKNVGAGQGVTTTMTLGGSDAGNYTLSTQPTLSGTIMAKDLQVFSSAVTTKVYNGSDAAVVTGAVLVGNATTDIDGKFIGTETVTLNGNTAGTFASKNVGAGQAVTTTMTLGGSDAGNYTLSTQPTLTGTIQAKGLSITSPSIGSKIYNGSAAAGTVTLGTLSGFVGSETVTASGAAADYISANVGSYSSAIVYTLSNGFNGGLASNYSLAAGSMTGLITAKDVTIASGSVSGKVYDGNTGAVVTAGSLSGLVLGESLGTTTAVGTFASKDVGTRNVAASYTLTDGANLAANYNLLNPTETLSEAITAKGLSVTAPSIASKKYDGTTAAGVVTVGTLSGFVGSEIVTAAGSAASYSSANVGSYSSAVSYTLSDGSNGGLAANYSLAAGSAAGAITAKDLVVNAAGIIVGKVYDGGTSINPATQVAIGSGSLTGNSTGANDGKYIGTEAVTLAVDAAGTFERNLPGTLIQISTTVKLASGNAVNNNYTLRAQPTGLAGEITGSATLDQNGASLSVNTGSFLHVRNTTATRMQGGLDFRTTTGEVLVEDSSFDGWMQRSTPNQTISDGGVTTFTFNETTAAAVNSPVLRIKMEANDPTLLPSTNLDYMVLGDYAMLLRHDPDGVAMSGDERAQTIFSSPGRVDDPLGFGSLSPSADLVIRDSAIPELKSLDYDAKAYGSLAGNGDAVESGTYAAVQGEFRGDNAASTLDMTTSSGGAAGNWDVTVSDSSLKGEGKVTDLRLKYNNNTKVLMEGPDGVRLYNVKFEGMDEVDVRTTDLNNRVLMSATLVTDPDFSKLVVKAGQTLEAVLKSDATFQEVKSLSNADLLAGVVRTSTGFAFVAGAERTLTIDGPGAAAANANINIAGQLALAAHTVVFNNANISSGGVIDVRTRDGMVNRTYGTVVPGTTSFTGANGNYFLNRGNGISMTIGDSGQIAGAFTGGKLTDVGSGGAGTVMSVGKVQ